MLQLPKSSKADDKPDVRASRKYVFFQGNSLYALITKLSEYKYIPYFTKGHLKTLIWEGKKNQILLKKKKKKKPLKTMEKKKKIQDSCLKQWRFKMSQRGPYNV